MLKPIFKKGAVSCSLIFQWNKNLALTLGGNYTDPLILFPADNALNHFAAWRTGIFAVQKLIHADFIYIDNLFGGYLGYSCYELIPFLLVAFFVYLGLFLRVMFSFIKASLTASSVQLNASPISLK